MTTFFPFGLSWFDFGNLTDPDLDPVILKVFFTAVGLQLQIELLFLLIGEIIFKTLHASCN